MLKKRSLIENHKGSQLNEEVVDLFKKGAQTTKNVEEPQVEGVDLAQSQSRKLNLSTLVGNITIEPENLGLL